VLVPHYKVRDPCASEQRATTPTNVYEMNNFTTSASSYLRTLAGNPIRYHSRYTQCFVATRSITMARAMRPRRFAPLNPEKKVNGDNRPVLKGIVFDVDGTLCEYPKR
jgi:hypothetical protein